MKQADRSGICVVAEWAETEFTPATAEVLGKARALCDATGDTLTAVAAGSVSDESAAVLFGWGADRVVLLESPLFSRYDAHSRVGALADFLEAERPLAVLIGADHMGREMAPGLAVRLDTGLLADCIDVTADRDHESGTLAGIKPWLDDGYVEILCPDRRPQIITLKPGALRRPASDSARTGPVVRQPARLSPEDILTHVVQSVRADGTVCAPETAEIVVAGGMGLRKRENFEKMAAFARRIGAGVGATRPLVSEGWAEHSAQIGQSGISVAPRIYIAFGISGSAQHLCGVNAELLIAVNREEKAPIFQSADYGFVGDCGEVLDALLHRAEDRGGL